MHGEGTYTYADGDGCVCVSRLVDVALTPFPHGSYKGTWLADKRHGTGTMEFVNEQGEVAERYTGEWYEDQMQGMGEYHYADDGTYTGQWVASKMHGKGAGAARVHSCRSRAHAWSPCTVVACVRMHGRRTVVARVRIVAARLHSLNPSAAGLFRYPNGNVYDGEWAEDMKEGFGVLVYANGERCVRHLPALGGRLPHAPAVHAAARAQL